MNGPTVNQIRKRRSLSLKSWCPECLGSQQVSTGENPGQRTLQLAKGKKINTTKTLGQISPYHRFKWSLHVVLDRAENRICCSHCFFPSFHRTGVGMAKMMLQGQGGDFGNNSKWVNTHHSKSSSFCFRWGEGSLSAGAGGIFVHKNGLLCPRRGCHWTHTAGRAGDCEQLWHPALLYLIQQQCLESKELFTILPGLTFLLAGLDTLTRASDVFSIGKALKRSRIAAPCSKPPFRRNLTNTGKFLPQTVVVRGEFIDSLIICFNIYCGFILKYLLFFLICALPTNIAVKKPSIMVRSALQGSREEQQMLQWHSLGVFFGY